MKKRIISLLVCFAVLAQFGVSSLAATLANFAEKRTFTATTFSDVHAGDWFYENVRVCYALGLIDGDAGLYNPSGYITVAETLKFAANLRAVYDTGSVLQQKGDVWYEVYADYAVDSGIIAEADYPVYNARAARSDFVKILAAALPDEATTPTNEVPDGAVPDVPERYSYGAAVYEFYRAGILTGGGPDGEFYPNRPISRAEAAAVLSRIVRPEQRALIQKVSELSAEEIYAKCEPAVFYIEVLNAAGQTAKLGSGFFITPDGLAVTNCHVIADAVSAKATLSTGEKLDITGMYAYDMATDVALIQIDGTGFPTLTTADYEPATGASVFTIGNPIGLVNSFSQGIVSTAKREIDGMRYIQIDAAISHGSSGGALLDAAGRVIGITSAGMNGGQNLNLAVPIGAISALSREKLYPFGVYPTTDKFYDGHFPAPDFGAYSGIASASESTFAGSLMISYDLTNRDTTKLVNGYRALLEKYFFKAYPEEGVDEDGEPTVYYNYLMDVVVEFEVSTRNGITALEIEVY
ncbi:MAG: trypsin-like peptidase domain-containing protein [Oscillospiraceae bacterium]|jgi:S1-C subfamily serine protease|nr:trypsin-like peptidase domain-containing protein [Oscillospiraceae bacterium]